MGTHLGMILRSDPPRRHRIVAGRGCRPTRRFTAWRLGLIRRWVFRAPAPEGTLCGTGPTGPDNGGGR